ncbi:Cation/calcium exchanger 5 [Acorus gramineus]|uniref:Cation/calcium exchanger 5 n=1 Tax=Acorus gramineus TaxID=55184 RepID=A0AAV8ZWX1_ACOGR|nr:Cation/calcium exchanger 5 [Acorus gramineus]
MVEYLPSEISDHLPMKVICEPSFPSGPKPFKYFEAWEMHPSFHSTVLEAWKVEVYGNPLFQFVKKLANTKFAIKHWNREVLGSIHSNLFSSKCVLEGIQSLLQHNPHDPLLISRDNEARMEYQAQLSQERCGLYFTAVLYVEHWCEEPHFNGLTLGESMFLFMKSSFTSMDHRITFPPPTLAFSSLLPPAILGLTVLAWGNSVGHLIAEVAIAKAGQPAMAIEEAEINKIIYHVGVRAMAVFQNAGVEVS